MNAISFIEGAIQGREVFIFGTFDFYEIHIYGNAKIQRTKLLKFFLRFSKKYCDELFFRSSNSPANQDGPQVSCMSTAEVVIAGGRIPLKENGRTVFVALDEVEFFEASGNYVEVHAGNGQYRVRETLSTFAERLPGRDFVRIHRSVIVNRNRIQELRRSFSGKYLVTLVSGKQVTLSRSHRQQLSALKEPF
jgi:DNA-binding LytR/AlgR family response regulator